MTTSDKLTQLRQAMADASADAYIIANADPHNNEYTAADWHFRHWLSGMKGSNGTVVVTAEWAGLWTDSRYYEAAEMALEGTGIELMKMSDFDVPSISEWLKKNLESGQSVGFNGGITNLKQAKAWVKEFNLVGIKSLSDLDLISPLWTDRPAAAEGELFIVEDQYAGVSIQDKIASVRAKMTEEKLDAHLLGRTDESCWLLNFRGTDMVDNTTPYCHTLVTQDKVILFINRAKITSEAREKFETAGVTISDYDAIDTALQGLDASTRLLIIPNYLNYNLAKNTAHCVQVESRAIVTDLKAAKNATEIKHFKQCHIDDGVAMVKFYVWLYRTLNAGDSVSELSASKKLLSCRTEMEGFRHASFESIMGYGPDGSLNHYSVDETNDKPVLLENIFLIDSGGNYLKGTTDTTRTIPMGAPTQEQKEDYTAVLSSMIELLTFEFAEGTTGAQLDGICRRPLWAAGRDFKHGTGHGVGFGLEVHEGPQNISGVNTEKMKLGMVTTIEPGCYRPGSHGIRIENMVHTVLSKQTDFGRFFKFENLTICPINTDLVDPAFLADRHRTWLNDYNQEVYEKISPQLNDEEREWLKHECRALAAS